MTKLDENKVAGFHLAQDVIPKTLSDECATTASGASSIQYVDLGFVEKTDERITPTDPAVGVVVCRRIADDEDRRQFWIDRLWRLSLRCIVDLDFNDTNRLFFIRVIRGSQLDLQIAACDRWERERHVAETLRRLSCEDLLVVH